MALSRGGSSLSIEKLEAFETLDLEDWFSQKFRILSLILGVMSMMVLKGFYGTLESALLCRSESRTSLDSPGLFFGGFWNKSLVESDF